MVSVVRAAGAQTVACVVMVQWKCVCVGTRSDWRADCEGVAYDVGIMSV